MGAASCGAASAAALVRRRGRDSPQQSSSLKDIIRPDLTNDKLIVFIKIRKKRNGRKLYRACAACDGWPMLPVTCTSLGIPVPNPDLYKKWRDSGLMAGAGSYREWLQEQGMKSDGMSLVG
jgi:hypothetical protein